MVVSKRWSTLLVILLAVGTLAPGIGSQEDPEIMYSGMRWRQIGPFRGGRITAVGGIAGDPATYYMGTAGGGVWETTDGGVVWKPIFDSVHVASIGALGVAPSNPHIIYVGTGDVSLVGGSANVGKGVYKSADGGVTWTHIGLENSEHIGALWIDPQNPDVVVVAALGHTFAEGGDRGIFKTTNGGQSWKRSLYQDEKTGGIDVVFDRANPKIGFCSLMYYYNRPSDMRGVLEPQGGGAIYKSMDGGDTWKPVGATGLPTGKFGRIGVATAQNGQRVFAIIAAQGGEGGLYRSDDGAATWQKISNDSRIQGSGYFGKVFVDPNNSDVVYISQTSLYRSDDGGKNFMAYKGAPGGDDNHALWIDPTNSKWMMLGSDQGGTISMDGGISWSTWYNQPTGQVYHLSTDNRFPYWVYGTQQDSGAIGTLSRGDYGVITFLDWDPVGGYEFGYILPDPLNPNMVYSGGPGRSLVRIDRISRQVAIVGPNVSRDADYRAATNPPLAFSPQDPHVLYEGLQYVVATRDGGQTWQKLSADLTARNDGSTLAPPPAPGSQAPPNRTAINTLAASPVRAGTIWTGTTNGLIQLTQDGGKTWQNVSPAALTQFSLVSLIEASPYDAGTAYAAVDQHQMYDYSPHIYRTRDFGHTWQEVSVGIAGDSFARAVREDPVRKGLLYAGTENGVYVSFDDGDHWQTLQLNLPTVSVRDLVVHGDDLVICTYGRAFWVLDDVAPLRQFNNHITADAFLFQPSAAIRVRRDLNGDTPIPPEMPAGDNPPNGAIIDYYLKSAPAGDLTIQIYDSSGALVRSLSSKPEPPLQDPPPNVPNYWLAKPRPLPKQKGMNRSVWDLRYAPPQAVRHDYPISALYQDTPADPLGALVVPGKYEVRLIVSGQVYRQALEVKLDPRVRVSQSDLQQQLELEKRIAAEMAASLEARKQVTSLRAALADREKSLESNEQAKETLAVLKELDKKAQSLESGAGRGFGGGAPGAGNRGKPNFGGLNGDLATLISTVDGADSRPTEPMREAYTDYCKGLVSALEQWTQLTSNELAAANAQLANFKLEPLPVPTSTTAPSCGN